MFVLQLNDMRCSKSEMLTPVLRADTSQALIEFLESEEVDGYNDENWHKRFKKDGTLEWYNPPMFLDESILDVGTVEIWIEAAKQRFENMVLEVPELVLTGVDKWNGYAE